MQISVVRVNPGGTGKPIDAISARLAPLPPRRLFFSARPSAWKLEFNRDTVATYTTTNSISQVWVLVTCYNDLLYNVPCFNLCRCVPMCHKHSRPVSITHIDITILVSRNTLNFICIVLHILLYILHAYLPPWKLCCF